MAKMTGESRGNGTSSGYFVAYWADREPVRGRYADERDNPLRVEDVLLQAYDEGRPLKLIWLADQMRPAAPLAADELTTVIPSVAADEQKHLPTSAGPSSGAGAVRSFCGNNDPTEPNTAVREGWKWLGPDTFSWWPQALAG